MSVRISLKLRASSLAMADLRLLSPYITKCNARWWVGVPCFANLESGRPGGRKIAVLRPYIGARERVFWVRPDSGL